MIYVLLDGDHEGLHITSYVGVFTTLELAQAARPGSKWIEEPLDPYLRGHRSWEGRRRWAEYRIITDEIDNEDATTIKETQ